jgi:LPXTG-motif cell wall-anchored protein
MSVARRFAVAFSVVGIGVLAYAVPVSATEGDPAVAAAETTALPCVDGKNLANLELVGELDPTQGEVVVRGKGGAPICDDQGVTLTLSIYKVPDTWDGSDFPGSGPGKAYPQTEIAHQTAVLFGKNPVTLKVAVPTCGNVQIDLYKGQSIPTIGKAGHPQDKIIFGYIWSVGGKPGQPKPCVTETTSPTPTPTTASPTPTATVTTTPAPTPTATVTTPAPPTATTPPAETTSAAVPPPATSPAPVEGTPAPVVVVPPKVVQVPTTPVLAQTGSDTTLPLLGIGGALVLGGLGLTLFGRRRRSA